ncbi:helix-turn-helix transcriptional regulator [Actinorhabdospora filicis]|uniref:Helix-turn-helix transcriptional regulator n=1 Tax=Actinorhabdospora filicis TaxID=1785913 RepID=A0A9W6SPD0_9ACTN|nr:helix-turn-helix transcriptional regulator [Actinorhabdospora filicis]
MHIVGGTGMGKTHHATRMAAADGVLVACRGLPDEPLATVRELLAALGAPVDLSGDRYDLCRRLRGLVAGRTLVLDDADHADADSAVVLRCLATRLPADATLVLTGVTALDAPGRRVGLVPLTPAEVAALTGEAARVHALTGGVPGLVHAVATGEEAAVREHTTRRLATMDPDARRLVESLALLGRPTPIRPGMTGLDEALAHGLATTDGDHVHCGPPLIAEAVIAATPHARRREHHAAILAELTRQPGDLTELLRHGRGAGDLAAVAAYAVDAALCAGGGRNLAGLLRELLADRDLPPRLRAKVGERLNHLVVTGLEAREAIALLLDAIADERIPVGARGELRLQLGLLLMNQDGDSDGGRAQLALAAAELRRRPALAARAMTALALPYWGSAPAAEHAGWLARAERALPERGDPGPRAAARVNLVTALLQFGDPRGITEAAATPVHADEAAVRRELLRGHSNVAAAALALGHDRAAATHLEHAEALTRRVSDVYTRPVLECTRLRLAHLRGDWDGLAERATAHVTAYADTPFVACTGALVLGELAIARGEFADAARHLAHPGLRPDPRRMEAEAMAAVAARARLAARTGEPAAHELLEALDRLRAKGLWTWAAELAHTAVTGLLDADDAPGAKALTAEFAAAIEGCDYPAGRAALAACRAALSGDPDAHAEAAALYAAIGRPYDGALQLEAEARRRSDTGPLTRALALLESLGATHDAARCARLLREHGEPPSRGRGRPGYGRSLSPRERDVARLLAAGRGNREIAEVLFLSVRTVEHHVASVLRKLDAPARDRVVLPPEAH